MADRFDAVLEVDGMIRDAEQRLAILRELRGRLQARQEQAPAPRAAKPRSAETRNGETAAAPPHASKRAAAAAVMPQPDDGPTLAGVDPRRRRSMAALARYILANGPARPGQLDAAKVLSYSATERIFADAEHAFFEKESDGIHLTAEGRQWIAGQQQDDDDA